MSENGARKFSKNERSKRNVLNLVNALLLVVEPNSTLDESELKAPVQVKWVSENTLQVGREDKNKAKGGEKVFEGTTKEALWQLAETTGNPLELPQRQREDSLSSPKDRQGQVVQDVFSYLKNLGVCQDKRPENKKNTPYWIFTLKLKHKDASINENLDVLQQKLQIETSPQTTDKSIDWGDICRNRLEKQKQLTTNRLMRAKAMVFNLGDFDVDLALVERKKPDKRSEDDPKKSRSYQPDYEETEKLEYQDFLAKVLKSNQSNKIAVIGEAGAGKTTLLQRVAFWILENTDSLPIWISLGNLPKPAPQLKEYLLNYWLEDAEFSITPKMKADFEKQLTAGKVWLLLDGVDEMAASGNPFTFFDQWIPAWSQNLPVILTCRLNIWEANPYALNGFQTYRTLWFSEEKVKQFIDNGFQKSDPELGIQLQKALNQPGKERIKDLVRNPLRLMLLCSIWHLLEGKLPDTKAELYQHYVEEVYRWKQDETTPEERQQLNFKLGELAKKAIDKQENRFCLQHKFIEGVFNNDSLFQLALKVCWLNEVGLDAKNPLKAVYAFYHPTFQEYFAATAIDNWDYFLPREHKDRPVNDKDNQNKYKPYRIFEPQWKEVILLWLGRGEERLRGQKEEFINALVKFEDRCGDFYKYRAYFIAAAGIAEFKDCSYTDEIVERVIEWKFGDINAKNNNFYLPNPIQNAAKAALLETHCENVVNTLNKWLIYSQIEKNFPEIAMILVQVAPGHSDAIRILVNYLHYLQQEFEHSKRINFHHLPVIEHLRKFSAGHPLATAALAERSQKKQQTKPIPSESDISRLNLSTGNEKFENFIRPREEIDIKKVEKIIGRLDDISILIILLERKPLLNTYSQDWEDINTLIEVLNKRDTSRNSVIYDLTGAINLFAVDRLAEIASIQSSVVSTLEEILNYNNNIHICQKITCVLGQAASKSIDATKAVVKLLTTTHEPIIASEAISFLKTILNSNLLAIVVIGLKEYIENSETYEIIWHCAQIMPYPDFYEAWHQDTLTNSAIASINLANLPQIFAEAIDNEPDLSNKLKLICIDISKFSDPDNPAQEIYDEILNQNCPEWQNGYPDTMQKLKFYWNSLRRQSEIPLFFICYDSTALSATPTGFSDSFLKALSKFDRAICVVCEQGNIPLPTFSPSQPDLVVAVVAWIRRSILENRHPI